MTAMVEKAVEGALSLINDVAQTSFATVIRSVSIHLSNCSQKSMLINPQVYTFSGYCYDPPQPTVKNGTTTVCAFGLTRGASRGSVGVLTYDITENRNRKAAKRLAIMFSVPFDYSLYENWFALGLFETSQPCDKSLYDLMYYNEGSFRREKASGSEISFAGTSFILIGTMSPMASAEIKLELWDKTNARMHTAHKKLSEMGKRYFKCSS